jgi:16S rRNA (adenine1518-N6/adenine1519-N6)-dimethyltransferase
MIFPLGFKPKKSLGQSFLISTKIADKIVDALELQPTDNVLEIGAGFGILTSRLAEKSQKIYAVELDERLIPILQENIKDYENIEIINQDILKFDWQEIGNVKIIGNIPYNISSEILQKLLQNIDIWRVAVLTTQREFTNKLIALPGKPDYCAMTVLFEYYTQRRKLFSISASSFRPSPKIISSAIIIKKRTSPLFTEIDFGIFSKVVQASFKQPRKTIANNLSLFYDIDKHKIDTITNLDLGRRAATYSINEFYQLTKDLNDR